VPDNSVLVAAFYREELERDGKRVNLTARAQPLLTAILEGHVRAFAPYALLGEFLKVSRDKSSTRQGPSVITLEDADAGVRDFLTLPIIFVPETELAERAWELTRHHGLSPTDAWFLACAEQQQADLWLSHWQKDGFAQAAQAVYERVFLLTDDAFRD